MVETCSFFFFPAPARIGESVSAYAYRGGRIVSAYASEGRYKRIGVSAYASMGGKSVRPPLEAPRGVSSYAVPWGMDSSMGASDLLGGPEGGIGVCIHGRLHRQTSFGGPEGGIGVCIHGR